MIQRTTALLLLAMTLIAKTPFAAEFDLPTNPNDSLIGDRLSNSDDHPEPHFYTVASEEDTLLDIARRFYIGQNEILLANPTVDRWLPKEGTKVKIPNSRILPNAPRKGIVINLPEYRMYYYPRTPKGRVMTYPISIGRLDWKTPLGKTKIVTKTRNPTWTPPASIKREHAERGDILPNVVPAGPDNPLGLYAMRLGVPGYLIHSTNKPFGVGMSVTHGCIRMLPENIEQLFPQVPVGTEVHIVNQPIKVGWFKDTLYIQVYPNLEDTPVSYQSKLDRALDLIIRANHNQLPIIDGASLRRALEETSGRPVPIYTRPAAPKSKTANNTASLN
ncbi:MAG: L,D-transpeptidase family protein [Methylomicrobium sp.]